MDFTVLLHISGVLRAPKDRGTPWLNQPVAKKGLFYLNTEPYWGLEELPGS